MLLQICWQHEGAWWQWVLGPRLRDVRVGAHAQAVHREEIFLSTLSIQCLDQRVPNIEALRSIVAAWQTSKSGGAVKWRFNTADSRIKLHRLYPSLP